MYCTHIDRRLHKDERNSCREDRERQTYIDPQGREKEEEGGGGTDRKDEQDRVERGKVWKISPHFTRK